jgi:adenosine deaminase
LHNAFGWGKEQFYEVNKNALLASFTNSETKKTLIQKLDEGYKLVD